MEKLKALPRVGETVEVVCMIMAVLSIAGGVICAAQFGKTFEVGYAGTLRATTSPALVVAWLAGGIGTAIFWWVLGKIGTALRWLEAIGDSDSARASIALEQAVETSPEGDRTVTQEAAEEQQPKPAPPPKSPEQIAKEGEESRRSMLLVGALLVAVAVAFFFLVGGRLR